VLSEMSREMGQLFFASVLLTPMLGRTLNLVRVYAGLLLSLICWYSSSLCAHRKP
jgi:hypothetical protein